MAPGGYGPGQGHQPAHPLQLPAAPLLDRGGWGVVLRGHDGVTVRSCGSRMAPTRARSWSRTSTGASSTSPGTGHPTPAPAHCGCRSTLLGLAGWRCVQFTVPGCRSPLRHLAAARTTTITVKPTKAGIDPQPGRQAPGQGAVHVHPVWRNHQQRHPPVHAQDEVSVPASAGPSTTNGATPRQGPTPRLPRQLVGRHGGSLPPQRPVARLLEVAGCSLLVSTYQAGPPQSTRHHPEQELRRCPLTRPTATPRGTCKPGPGSAHDGGPRTTVRRWMFSTG